MGFSLRNFLEEATAQINPFDSGKTAATVRAKRARTAPAQTTARIPYRKNFVPAPAKPKAPSYGSGVQGLWNKAKDVVDANTEQDIWKRQQRGEKANYFDQRRAVDPNYDRTSRGLVEQTVFPAIGSASSMIAKLPGDLIEMGGGALSRPTETFREFGDKIINNLNPVETLYKKVQDKADWLPSTPMQIIQEGAAKEAEQIDDEYVPESVKKAGREVEGYGQYYKDKLVQENIDKSRFTPQTLPGENRFVTNLSSGAGSLGTAAGLTLATGGNANVAGGTFGLRAAGDMYSEARREGVKPSEALSIAADAGVAEGALEKFGLERLFAGSGGGFLKAAANGFSTEASQEAAQSLAGSASSGRFREVDWGDAMKQAAEEGFYGGILGILGGGGINKAGFSNALQRNGVDPQTANNMANNAEAQVEQAKDVALKTNSTTGLIPTVNKATTKLVSLKGNETGAIGTDVRGLQLNNAQQAQGFKDFDTFYNNFRQFFNDNGYTQQDAQSIYEAAVNAPLVPAGAKGTRISSEAQTQFEQAYTSGNMEQALNYAKQIQDPSSRQTALEAISRKETSIRDKSTENITNPVAKRMIEAAKANNKKLSQNEGGYIQISEDNNQQKETPMQEAKRLLKQYEQVTDAEIELKNREIATREAERKAGQEPTGKPLSRQEVVQAFDKKTALPDKIIDRLTAPFKNEAGFIRISEDPIVEVEKQLKKLNPDLDISNLTDKQKRIALANAEQQKSKKTTDTGKKMFGSKKDLAKLRRITEENIKEIENEGERVAAKLVTKQRVLGDKAKYNVDTKGDPAIEKLKTLQLSGIPNTPVQSAEARAWYVKNIPKYQEAIANAKTVEDVRAARDQLVQSAMVEQSYPLYGGGFNSRKVNFLKKYVGSRAYNLIMGYGKAHSELRFRPPTDFSFAEKKTSTQKGVSRKGQPMLHGGEQQEYSRKGAPSLVAKDPKSMVRDFGFKGLEYGNYVKESEAKTHMNKFGDSMYDLEKLLDLDMTNLVKQMDLGVAFGSRGGGRALAHYEGANKVINITKKNTVDGSLAHEFMHALDDFLGEGKGRDSYASSGNATQQNTREAVRELMEAIKFDENGGRTIQREQQEARNWSSVDRYVNEADSAQEIMSKIIKAYPGTNMKTKESIAQQVMAKKNADSVVIPTGRTNFYESAKEKGDYWARETELLARAMAQYVANKQAKAGIENNYVAHDMSYSVLMSPDNMDKLEPLFDNFFKAIKSDYKLGDPQVRKTTDKTSKLVENTKRLIGDETGAIGEDVRPEADKQQDAKPKAKLETQQDYATDPKAIADALDLTQDEINGINKQEAIEEKRVAKIAELSKKGSKDVDKDIKDQEDFGALEIRDKPTATLEDAFDQILETPDIDPELLENRRTSGYEKFRDSLAKFNVLKKGDKAVDKALQKANNSGNSGARAVARTAQYVYSKQAGQTQEMIDALHKHDGEITYNTAAIHKIAGDIYQNQLQTEDSRARVHQVLDPQGTDTELKFKDLSPAEQNAAKKLRVISDAINDTSYRAGKITEAAWRKNRGGRYIARMYQEIQNSDDVSEMLDIPEAEGIFTGMYKNRVEMNEDMKQRLLKDPVKLVAVRARQATINEALMDYFTTAEKQGYVSQKPRKGFVQVPYGDRYLNWSGKYVKQDVYENINGFMSINKAISGLNTAFDWWDGLPPRRIRKKLLTLYNPVVRTGNVTSNYFFAYLNGINPIQYQKNKKRAKKIVQSLDDPLSKAIRRSGLLDSSIVGADPNLFNKKKDFQSELELSRGKGFLNTVKKKKQRVEERYGEADAIAKTAAVLSHIEKGYSVQESIEKARRGFQDYSRVGHAYDISAKSPVFGNAFIRFQGDLWMNIMKNATVDHPLRVAAMPYATLALGNALSSLAGEDDEDKKTREERAGAAAIPLTRYLPGTDRNISLEFQTPFGAFDAARFTPLYLRRGVDKDNLASDLSDVLPFNIPESNTKAGWASAAASDPLIGPVLSTIFDTDWRGKSVEDPYGKKDGKLRDNIDRELTSSEKWQNRRQYLLRSLLPYPFNEIGDIGAALRGDTKTEQSKEKPEEGGYNTQGSLKTPAQAFARLAGLRIQKFGKEEAKEQRKLNKSFEKSDIKRDILDKLPNKTRKAYDALHNYTLKREGGIEFDEDLRYTMKRASAWLEDKNLIKVERRLAKLDNKLTGKPLHPKWSLKPKQLEAVLRGQTFNPGEGTDTKAAQLYNQEWHDNYQEKLNPYYKKLAKWNKGQGNKPYKPKYKYPEGTKFLSQKARDYYNLPSGEGTKTRWLETIPGLAKLLADRKEYTNKKRVDLGLEPQENWYAQYVQGKKYLGASDGSNNNFYGGNRSRRSSYRRGGSRYSSRSGGSLRGTGGTFDYKLYGFGNRPTAGSSKSLRQLVEEATIS